MKNLWLLWVGLTISILLYVTTIIFQLDLFEGLAEIVSRFELFEADELIIPTIVFSLFALVFCFIQIKQTKIEAEKAKIYTAMLSSTYHILNNLLNQMQLFRITATETPDFNRDTLSKFDESVDEAKFLIKKLSEISAIDEASIKASVGSK